MGKSILVPQLILTLTPREFVGLTEEQRKGIETVSITAPILGRRGFGSLVIKWKHPKLRRDLRKELRRGVSNTRNIQRKVMAKAG